MPDPYVGNFGSRGAFWGSDNPYLPASDTGGPQVIANHGGPGPGDPGYDPASNRPIGYGTGQTYPGVGTSPIHANIFDPLGTGQGAFSPSSGANTGGMVDDGGGLPPPALGDGYSSPNSIAFNPYKQTAVQGTQGPFQLDPTPEQSGGGGGLQYISPADRVGDALYNYSFGGNMFGHPRSMFSKL